MAAEPGLVVKDFSAYQKSWKEMEKAEAREERARMKGLGEIVRADAATMFAPVSSRSAGGYRVRVRAKGVAVAQSLKRTTGFHPQFGSLQMKQALMPAMARNQDEVEKQFTQMLDEIGRREGF